jgi:hypothetical protein
MSTPTVKVEGRRRRRPPSAPVSLPGSRSNACRVKVPCREAKATHVGSHLLAGKEFSPSEGSGCLPARDQNRREPRNCSPRRDLTDFAARPCLPARRLGRRRVQVACGEGVTTHVGSKLLAGKELAGTALALGPDSAVGSRLPSRRCRGGEPSAESDVPRRGTCWHNLTHVVLLQGPCERLPPAPDSGSFGAVREQRPSSFCTLRPRLAHGMTIAVRWLCEEVRWFVQLFLLV